MEPPGRNVLEAAGLGNQQKMIMVELLDEITQRACGVGCEKRAQDGTSGISTLGG